MKRRNIYRIGIGAFSLLMGIFYLLLIPPGDSLIGPVFITCGLVFLITGIIRHRRYGESPESDVRTRKIGARGLSYAWLTGIFYMWGLFLADYFKWLRIGTQPALGSSIVILALSAAVYQAYLFRKGDVDW
jgi:hypothetical protein